MKIVPRIVLLTALAAVVAAGSGPRPQAAETYDILIRGARIIDGTGRPSTVGDIGIRGDSILAVGDLRGAKAAVVIPAAGLVVSPGFIDMHTHCDNGFGRESTKGNLNYLTQGVTTVVTGNCGMSPWPIGSTAAAWEKAGMGTNAVLLVGLGTLREKVLGEADRAPTADELLRMKALVEQGMREGAVGVSSGLQYVPSKFASTAELIELAKVAARFGGLYATHMRSEEEKLLEAVREALRIGREAGLRVEISHLKSSGRPNWGRLPAAIRLVEQARAQGLEAAADIYPYNKSATTTLEEIFNVPRDMEPLAGLSRKMAGPMLTATERESLVRQYAEALAAALADPARREKIRRLTEGGVPDRTNWVAKGGWDNFTIMYSRNRPELAGRMFRDLAAEMRRSEFDIAADLFVAERDDLIISLSAMDAADLRAGLSAPWSMISSDGDAVAPGTKELVHPRNYGAFARVLARFVREDKLLTLEQAVHKMTGLPARMLRLADRGEIKPGFKADLVVFDPAAVLDKATFTEPHQYAAGIRWVFLAGRPALEAGRWNGRFLGRVLRPAVAVR
jgi:N-acyl-D-amino-acid deacylase